MTTDTKPVNLAELSDEEIMNMDGPPVIEEDQSNEDSESEEGQGSTETPGSEESDQGNPSGDADGAAAEAGSSDDEGTDTGSTSEEEDAGTDNQGAASTGDGTSSEDDQSSEQEGSEEGEEQDSDSDNVDYKSEYGKLMAPFRAAKREISLDNIEDARRLMQMGVDYSRKMESMKPYLRTLRTLEKAQLLDPKKINFLIDLDKKNPEAIKKLLKSADIDPVSLNLEDSEESYSPTDHAIGDEELAVTEVLDSIKDSPSFDKTVNVISEQLDTKSKQTLKDNPGLIVTLHEHIDSGLYDQIMNKVASERMFNRLAGLSDLEAYYKIGDAIHKAGGFKTPGSDESSSSDGSQQGTAQGSGSQEDGNSSESSNLRDRRRAAGPTGGAAGDGNKVKIDLSKMSDEDVLKFDVSTLP